MACLNIEKFPSLNPPILRRCRDRSIRRPAGCIHPSTRPGLLPAVWHLQTPTCRTFPPARSSGEKSVRRSLRMKACCCFQWIIHRSNCGLWRICPAMKPCWQRFRQGQDIHATTAAAIYGVKLDEVTSSQRRHAKAINFGLIYGMSPFGLSRSTELTLAEAEDFVKAYFKQFPACSGISE